MVIKKPMMAAGVPKYAFPANPMILPSFQHEEVEGNYAKDAVHKKTSGFYGSYQIEKNRYIRVN